MYLYLWYYLHDLKPDINSAIIIHILCIIHKFHCHYFWRAM